MTSAKSSVNPFRFMFFRTIKKNWYFPAMISAIITFTTLICGLIDEWMIYNNHRTAFAISFKERYSDRYYILGDSPMRSEVYMAFMMLLAMATGIMIFRFMMSKKAVNVYYSLGISRKNMFLSKYLSGASMIIFAVLLPLAVDVIANIAIFGSCKELWITALFYFLGTSLSLLFAYSVAVAVCCRVGTIIEAIVYSGVFLLAPMILTYVIEFFFRLLLYGSPIYENDWIYGWNYSTLYGTGETRHFDLDFEYNTVPFADVFNFSYVLHKTLSDWGMPDFTSLIPLAVLIVAVVLIALVTYKKRKTEIAGFLGSDELTKGLSVFLISAMITCFAIRELIAYSPDIAVFCICLTAIIFLIVYLLFDIITIHSIKRILKSSWKFLIHMGVVALCVIIFSTGLFGYSSKVPDFEDVESVSVSTGTGDIFMNYGELASMKSQSDSDTLANYYLLTGFGYQGIVDGFTSQEDIGYIIDIHEKFIDCKNLKVNDETLNAGYGKRVLPVNINIIYHLKNGETIERLYSVATDEIMQMLAKLTETDRYKEIAIDYINAPLPEEMYDESIGAVYYQQSPIYENPNVTKVETVGYAFSSEIPFTFRGSKVAIASPLLSNLTYIPQLNGDSDLKDGLFNAICADIENDSLPLNFRSDEEVLGYIVFSRFYTSEDEYAENDIRYQGGTLVTPDMTEPVKINVFGGEFKMCKDNRVSIPVYADMQNTVNYLTQNGLDGYLEETMKPSKIRIWTPDEQSAATKETYNGASMLWSGWWLNTNETCVLIPGNAVSVTGADEIANFSKQCRMICLSCYETRFAEIIFEDGSRTFAAVPIS